MKKIYGLFILAISLFVLACSNSSSVDDNSKLGKIAIQLPASSKNARNVIVASAESTAYYVITLEGPSPTSVRDTGGSVVAFEELQPGEYTIVVEAYSVEDYCISSASATAVVRAGEITSVNLTLAKNIYANTSFALWNIASRGGYYNFNTFSSTPTNNDLIITDNGKYYIDNTCVVEDNDGKVYHIYQKNIRVIPVKGGDIFLVTAQGSIIDAPLYCDETTNSVFLYLFNGSNNETKLFWIDSSKVEVDAVYHSYIPQYTVSGMPEGTPKMFAIRGNDFYVVVKNNEVESLYYMEFSVTAGLNGAGIGEISVSTPKQILSVAPSTESDATGISKIRGKFTDITIASDGMAYALICDDSLDSNSRIALSCMSTGIRPSRFTSPSTVYSRGAIAKITSSGSVTYLGYHDELRNLAVNDSDWNSDFSRGGDYVPKLNLYAPTKTQSQTQFYGPQKIIAKKPGELYIVDCGVNFTLADIAEYKTGNAYVHNRIMKVDLKTFGLSVDAETTRQYYGGDGEACLFRKLSLSSNIFRASGSWKNSDLDDEI